MQGIKGEVIVNYYEPLITQQMEASGSGSGHSPCKKRSDKCLCNRAIVLNEIDHIISLRSLKAGPGGNRGGDNPIIPTSPPSKVHG